MFINCCGGGGGVAELGVAEVCLPQVKVVNHDLFCVGCREAWEEEQCGLPGQCHRSKSAGVERGPPLPKHPCNRVDGACVSSTSQVSVLSSCPVSVY